MLIATAACRVAKSIVPHLRLASVLLASESAGHHQCALVHSKGAEQLATFRTVATPVSRSVAPKFGAAAHRLSAGISAYAGRPCSISRPWDLVTTAAATFATNGSTGGAAGKTSKVDRWSSKVGHWSSKVGAWNSKGDRRSSKVGPWSSKVGPWSSKVGRWSSKVGAWNSKVDRRSSKGRSVQDINVHITSCTSIQQLQKLVRQDGADMDYINLAAAVVKLQKLLNNLNTRQQQQAAQQSALLLDQLWQLQQPKLPQCRVRQLSNMIYSICLLPTLLQQHYQWVITQHLLPAFMRQVSTANSQDVSNVLYGMAASGQQLPEQSTQLLVDRLVAVLRNANSQDVANALWAVTKMQQQIRARQLQRLLDALCVIAHEANPQNIANTLWAVATMQQQVQPMQLQQLLGAFCAVAHKAKPQAIANTLWAVATMKQQVEQLDQMLRAFVMQLSEAAPQEVSNTLLACAEFRYLPKQLLTAPASIDKLAAANPQELANTAWACGQLGYRDEQLMSALLNRVLGLAGSSKKHLISSGVTAQTLANLCWSLAVLDMRKHAPAALDLVQAGKPLWASMAPEGVSQLYQVHMWLTDHSLATGQGLAGVSSTQQLQQCQSTWQQQLGRTAASESGLLHESVYDALQRISVKWLEPPAMEQVSLGSDGQPDGAALIDITARTVDGVWLAVEADGPWHFRRPDRGLMGPTLYRNRALAARGYVLISVPYFEWNKQHGSKLKQQYLQDRVTAALLQAAINTQSESFGRR